MASDLTGTMALAIGTTFTTTDFSNGTVLLAPAMGNTYSGGTTLNSNGGITLALGSNNALGSGTLTIAPTSGGVTTMVGLKANAAGLVIPNNINFPAPDYVTFTTGPAQLNLTGSNNFTLAGNISSSVDNNQGGVGGIVLNNVAPINVTLSGNNSNYHGALDVLNGTLFLASNFAAGTGTLGIDSSTATAAFTGAATNPVLYGISGTNGSLVLPNGTALTFDASNQNNSSKFGGVISGPGGAATTASLSVIGTLQPTADSPTLYLYGSNNYTGGTTVTNDAVLALGSNNAAGSGPVVVNTTVDGGLALNRGVTFTNNLTFTSGNLGGFGTFAPANLSSITFGTGQRVVPGLPGISKNPVGTLTFNTGADFANGGTMNWSLQDQTRADGYSLLAFSGSLAISASGGGFTIKLGTFDAAGNLGAAAAFNPAVPASFTIVTAAGGITGFNPSAFTIDASSFLGGAYTNPSYFNLSLGVTGNSLILNFTAIPEPSSYALMSLGLAAMALVAKRRSCR